MKTKTVRLLMSQKAKDFYTESTGDGIEVFGRISGYRRMAHAAGVHVLTTPTVTYNGEKRSNPHIVRDGGKMVEMVCRKIAFGFDYHGTPVAVDQTIIFNPLNYLAKNLIDISKKYPSVARICTTGSLTQKDLKSGMFIPIADSGISAVGVFVPVISHRELDNIWSDHHESVLYADRNAQIMCEKAAIKKHPGIPTLNASMLLSGLEELIVDVTSHILEGDEAEKFLSISSKIELGKEVEIKKTASVDELV